MLKQLVLKLLPEPVLQPLRRRHYVRVVAQFSEDEEPDLKVVKHLVDPGATVFDIGANIGVYTSFLSKYVGDSGAVYSVEPVPPTFRVLQSVVSSLGLRNVTAINCAISAAEGVAQMIVPRFDTGGRNFYQARLIESSSNGRTAGGMAYQVKTRPLDSLAEEFRSSVSFIKIDVEGHELSCIQSGSSILERHRPSCLVEVSGAPDDPDSPAFQLIARFRELDYSVYWFDGASLRERKSGDQSVNYFFLQENHLQRLRALNFPLAPDV